MAKTVYRPRILSTTVRRLMEELARLTLEMEKKPGALAEYNRRLDGAGLCLGEWETKLNIAREVLNGG